MDFTTTGMVTSVRRLTATVNSRVVTDDEVVEYLQASLNDLYDTVVTTYEDGGVFRRSYPFALTNTSTLDLHSLDRPFYKFLGLDYVKGAGDVQAVHRTGSFQGRNRRAGTREYEISGSELQLLPANASQVSGSYVLHFVPQMDDLVLSDPTPGQTNLLPIELRPWREALVVGASITVATKRNMTDLVATLTDRYVRLQARIVKTAANRDANEPMRAPIIGERVPGAFGLGRDPDSVV